MKTTRFTLTLFIMVSCVGGLASCTTSPDGSRQGVSVTAGEAKEAAGNTMHRAGNAIKSGAAKADNAIQDTVGNGSSSSNYPAPASSNP